VETIGQPFLSYDNYSLVGAEMLDYFYNNLELVRRISLDTKTPFWNCILANGTLTTWSLRMRHSTFRCTRRWPMAAGIQYFTYYSPHNGNYRSVRWTSSATRQQPGTLSGESTSRFTRLRDRAEAP